MVLRDDNGNAVIALRVASSIFSEGLMHLQAGRFTEALANFEASLSTHQKLLTPSALKSINCYHLIASVHDKLGNLRGRPTLSPHLCLCYCIVLI